MSTPRVLILYPYLLDRSCWVFDDERTGLKEGAFVLGMSEMITRVVRHKAIADADSGFTMTFSDQPFADHDVELRWLRPDPVDGNWYEADVVGEPMEGWLCPALLLYLQNLPPGVSGRRFVEPPRAANGPDAKGGAR